MSSYMIDIPRIPYECGYDQLHDTIVTQCVTKSSEKKMHHSADNQSFFSTLK